MNSITLADHRCADKCTDFKKNGEQCNHCIIPESQKESFVKNHLQLLSSVGGIKNALSILQDNPDSFDFYSIEKKYYYDSKVRENLLSLVDLQQACNSYFLEIFGGIKAIKYIIEQAPQGSTHYDRYFEKIDFQNKSINVWVEGDWALQELRIPGFSKAVETSISLDALRTVLETYQPLVLDDLDPSNEVCFSYSQLTQNTIDQIEFFNNQKAIAEADNNVKEANSFDDQADGAYLLWLRLTKNCRSKFDNERLQVLVGAKS